MTSDPGFLEERALDLVTTVLTEYKPQLRSVGLTASDPQITRAGEAGSTYQSEIAIYFSEVENIEDFLEFFVYRAGVPDTTLEKMGSWLREMLDDIIYEKRSKPLR